MGRAGPSFAPPCYAGVAEVSLYVADDCRGRGVGNKLLTALIESSEQNGIWTLYGSTFPENIASLRMQERCGFRLIGKRERIGKLKGVWRDTVLTERRSKSVGADRVRPGPPGSPRRERRSAGGRCRRGGR